MNRPLRAERVIALGILWAASLWTLGQFAPAGYIDATVAAAATVCHQLERTLWIWPLAGTLALTVLSTRYSCRRWPKLGTRIRLGIIGTLGLIVATGSAMTVGLGRVLLTLSGLLLVGVLAYWLLVVPSQLAPALTTVELSSLSGSERIETADGRLKLQNDMRTTALQAIVGLAVLTGAFLAFQQLAEDRTQTAADRELTRQGQASERFTRAITQLGSDRPEVQVGGIYGLEQIAYQAPDNRLPVIRVLVAYLHRRVPRTENPPPEPADLRVRAPDIQAALTVLAHRTIAKNDPTLDLRALDIRNADFFEANLSFASLRASDLRGADFLSAKLTRVDLSDGDLRGANLTKADLRGADLRGADLRRADLSSADLRDADLWKADLRSAKADAHTIWPDGFDWRRAGVRLLR